MGDTGRRPRHGEGVCDVSHEVCQVAGGGPHGGLLTHLPRHLTPSTGGYLMHCVCVALVQVCIFTVFSTGVYLIHRGVALVQVCTFTIFSTGVYLIHRCVALVQVCTFTIFSTGVFLMNTAQVCPLPPIQLYTLLSYSLYIFVSV